MTWIKFHEALTKGAKRGIRRAHRFVYLELSLLARPRGGFVELPVGMGDVDGVIDLLGGDQREVRDALKALSSGDDPMIRFSGADGSRRVEIVSWERWNERPGASTERVRRHRERSGNAPETETERPCNALQDGFETAEERSGNASREEKRREEKKEEEIGDKSPPDPGGSDSVRDVWDAYMAGWHRHVGRGVEPKLTASRRSRIRARIKDHGADVVARAGAGVWRSTWHLENRRTDPDLVFRDAEHVERFASLADPIGASAPGPLFAADAVVGADADYEARAKAAGERARLDADRILSGAPNERGGMW